MHHVVVNVQSRLHPCSLWLGLVPAVCYMLHSVAEQQHSKSTLDQPSSCRCAQVVERAGSSWCVLEQEQHGQHSHQRVFLPCATDQPAANLRPVSDASTGPLSSAPTVSAVKTSWGAASPGHSRTCPAASILLGITLALPEPTAEDVMYKKGEPCAAAMGQCFFRAATSLLAWLTPQRTTSSSLQAMLPACIWRQSLSLSDVSPHALLVPVAARCSGQQERLS